MKSLNRRRSAIGDMFMEFYDTPYEKAEVSTEIFVSLCYLTPAQVTQVEEAITYLKHEGAWSTYWGSVGHDIHGLRRCVTGPAYHRDTFVPRLVGRERVAA